MRQLVGKRVKSKGLRVPPHLGSGHLCTTAQTPSSLLSPPAPPPGLCPRRCPVLSGGGPSRWTVGRSVGVSLVPPPLAAGQFWTKACKPLTPAHICTHTCTHAHTRRDECTGAHARSHGIRGGNGFRAPPADACQSWGPRQTAGPPPHRGLGGPGQRPSPRRGMDKTLLSLILYCHRYRQGSGWEAAANGACGEGQSPRRGSTWKAVGWAVQTPGLAPLSSHLSSLCVSPVAPEAWLALTTRSNKPW